MGCDRFWASLDFICLFVFGCLFSYFERKREERGKRSPPSAGSSLPRWPRRPPVDQAEARRQELQPRAPAKVAGAQTLAPSSAAFPLPLADSGIESGGART